MKKLDYFSCGENFSSDILGYMENIYIARVEKSISFDEEIEKAKNSILAWEDKIENIKKNPMDNNNLSIVETLDGLEKAQNQLKKLTEQKNKAVKSCDNYKMADSLKNLERGLKDVKNGKLQLEYVIKAFYKSYNVDIKSTNTLNNIKLYCVSYNNSIRTIVNSEGKTCLYFDVTRTYKNIICYCFEQCVKSGSLKPAKISEPLRLKYLKVAKDKKTKSKLEKVA